MRIHYITLCIRGNTEVSHVMRNNKLEVTFEMAVPGGFNTAVVDDMGNVISNSGFNGSDLAYFSGFVSRHKENMLAEQRGEL